MRIIKGLAALFAGIVLTACGGGGGGAGTPPFGGGGGGGGGGGPTPGQPSIALSLSSDTVTAGAPATVSAVVRDGTGAGVAGQVVTFSTSGGLGAFSVNTALTDATGTAVVSLSPAPSASTGADQVIAQTTLDGAALQAAKGFQLTATTVTIASFTSDLTTLSAFGQSTLTVVLNGAPASTPVSISVSSACVAKGKATLTPTSATTSTGSATFTYRDQGCGATDATDSLQAVVGGTAATASLSIGLTSPTVSSITFVSASFPTIFLAGSGFNETSEVTFQVRDTAGNGLPNQTVTLEPTTLTGGLKIDGGSVPVTKNSDSNGNVIVRINSGTVPTPMRVKASLTNNPTVSTVSSNLSIAVGLPSELNFSLSQGTRNIEGFNIDGIPNTYNIIASDRLGNPVPNDTAINFVTEGGQIEASKFTQLANGLARATANFVSASPRPADGRVTILAYALGEESFLDVNGNNVWEAGEDFQDLGNIFVDRFWDEYFHAPTDQFVSLNISGSAACQSPSSPLLAFDRSISSIRSGNSSQGADTCDGTWGRAYVRKTIETVLSTSEAGPVWNTPPAGLRDCVAPPASLIVGYNTNNPVTAPFRELGDGQLFVSGAVGTLSFVVSDANPIRLNPMAAETTVGVTGTKGLTATVVGGSPVPSSLEATFASITYEFDATTTSGTLTISFTSPSGLKTTVGQLVTRGAPAGAACP